MMEAADYSKPRGSYTSSSQSMVQTNENKSSHKNPNFQKLP